MGFSSTPEKLPDFTYLNCRIHKYNTQMYWIYILSSVRAFLNCGEQNWTQYTTSGLTPSGMITSLSLLVTCLQMQPRICFASIVAMAHCLLTLSLMSPRSLSARLLPGLLAAHFIFCLERTKNDHIHPSHRSRLCLPEGYHGQCEGVIFFPVPLFAGDETTLC